MMTMMCLINSSISARYPDEWLQLSEYKSKEELNNHSLACGWCWLLSDWYCIGCQNNNKYPPITILSVNIAQYPITQYQYCSNPTLLTCWVTQKELGCRCASRQRFYGFVATSPLLKNGKNDTIANFSAGYFQLSDPPPSLIYSTGDICE